ncbi:hypothetical protein TWF694_008794 [Orbilia ellipsospora]|uniref:LysM domain-containing protein n=1 Tax=Orbilia ellipsospora TaxID=2528407 RepID=A0AAV9XCZ2_9PEZI
MNRQYTMLETFDPPGSAACSTCQKLLHNVNRQALPNNGDSEKRHPVSFFDYDEKTLDYGDGKGRLEKPSPHYQSDCCGRYVCALCAQKNPRFIKYCPFCPIKHSRSTTDVNDTTLSDPTLPPPYSPTASTATATDLPPAYSTSLPPLLHHLHPSDSITTLSLRYSIPPSVLRSHNRLYADSLLSGRSYILIPREYYSGPSLSPNPVQSVEESTLKRFQVWTKCVEYDIAKIYLEESGWDFDKAVERWEADESWERINGASSSSSAAGSSRVRAGKATGKAGVSEGMRKGFFR